MNKLTKAQRAALNNAFHNGNVWNYRAPQVGGFSMVWSAAKQRMHNTMVREGLIDIHGVITKKGVDAFCK